MEPLVCNATQQADHTVTEVRLVLYYLIPFRADVLIQVSNNNNLNFLGLHNGLA